MSEEQKRKLSESKKNSHKDLTGQKFGYLTAIERVGTKGNGAVWRCVCDCGNEKIATAKNLKSGDCKSCGCKRREYYSRGRKIAVLSEEKQKDKSNSENI